MITRGTVCLQDRKFSGMEVENGDITDSVQENEGMKDDEQNKNSLLRETSDCSWESNGKSDFIWRPEEITNLLLESHL